MEECLRELAQTPEAESDEYLVQLIRMQRLAQRAAHLGLQHGIYEGLDASSKAPISGYILVFKKELDDVVTNLPATLRDDKLIKSRLNNIRIRLNEPPILDAALLTAISTSLASDSQMPGVPTHLDAFYHSSSALRIWYQDWLSVPVSSYYSLPLSVHIDLIYTVTTLGRWAKLVTPSVAQPVTTVPPPDPSGSWNNPTKEDVSSRPPMGGQLMQAVMALKTQLAAQPGLGLNAIGILGTLSDRLEQASDLLKAGGTEPQAWERNVWGRNAIKMKIAQLKLEQFAALTIEENMTDESSDEMDLQEDNEDVDVPSDSGKNVEIAVATKIQNVMNGWTGDILANMGWPMTGDWYEGFDPLLWAVDRGPAT
ncbi:hypothetical protein ACHAQH_009620 [Verticillium albo-atrum]